MSNRRRLIIMCCLLVALNFSTGCFTRLLYKSHYQYTEDVSSVLVTKDEKNLIFIGKDYHYIFQAPDRIINTFKASYRDYVSADFWNFHVDNSGDVTGDFELRISKGERPNEDRYSGKLKGKRYSSGAIQAGTLEKLNKTYKVRLTAERTASERTARAILTPITLAADGTLFLASIPLVIVPLTVMGDGEFAGCLISSAMGGKSCRFGPDFN